LELYFRFRFDLLIAMGIDILHRRNKFEASRSNHFRDMEVSQNFKNRSRVPIPTPIDLILHFLLVPLVVNMPAKFEISSSNRSRYMEGIPKFQK